MSITAPFKEKERQRETQIAHDYLLNLEPTTKPYLSFMGSPHATATPIHFLAFTHMPGALPLLTSQVNVT